MSSDHPEHPQGPIARVPPDVLLEIFDACRIVNDVTFDDVPSSLGPENRVIVRAGPPAVAAVCQSWHNLAIHTPTLWTDVHIKFRTYSDNLSSAAALLRVILSRSAELPLSISMRSHCNKYIVTDAAKALVDVLIEHCARWTRLDVFVSETIFHLLLPARGRLAQLRSVRSIFRFKMLARLDWTPLRDLFSDCPALTDVEHWGPQIDFPWEQLERLSLKGRPSPAALERTTRARALYLTEQTIERSSHGLLRPESLIRVERPLLHKLTVARGHRLRCFRAPNLAECHVIKDTLDPEDLAIVTHYVRGEGVKLTTLSISVGSALSVELSELFAHCDALQHLQLRLLAKDQSGEGLDENTVAFNDALSSLVVRHDRRAYLPALRRLGIMMIWVTCSEEVASLYDIVRSRALAPDIVAPCLETLVLRIRFGLQHPTSFPDEINNIKERLQSCRLEGKPAVDIDHDDSVELRRLWCEEWTMV
ncbi:uncharacterized protein SCHCODRAFT_02625763 [Schizophyllum commune H4-8]|nr:uncharacterized protein SCHCODRAFT_02625763 [Schizophyllum commune H4-8]KAI5892282.1 hypothetical protein SCHCODRAFT_02625763 [Schizophyllum commune H4-8]